MFTPADYLDLAHTAHPKLFENQNYVWEALKQIASYLQFRLKPAVLGELLGKPFVSNNVFIGPGTIVEPGAVLKGPAWIGEKCHIRSGCYVRENVIVGNGVVMGNSCEFKNCILFDEVQAPHFNYVGDSILGHRVHLRAPGDCRDLCSPDPYLKRLPQSRYCCPGKSCSGVHNRKLPSQKLLP